MIARSAICFAFIGIASAHASQVDRMAVLPVIVAGGDQATVSSVFAAVTDAAFLRPRLVVMSIDDYYFNDGGDLANRALSCGQDTACIAKQLAPFNAQIGLVVIINLEIQPPLLSFILLDINEARVVKEVYDEVKADVLSEEITRRISQLLEKIGYQRAGRIIVEPTPKRALVMLANGQPPDVGSPNIFTVPPGDYEIIASLEGYRGARAATTVESGGVTTVAIDLSEEVSLLESPWLWGAVGVVVIGAAAATAIALSEPDRCVCLLTKDGRDCQVCQ